MDKNIFNNLMSAKYSLEPAPKEKLPVVNVFFSGEFKLADVYVYQQGKFVKSQIMPIKNREKL